jgi:hypothetical protein
MLDPDNNNSSLRRALATPRLIELGFPDEAGLRGALAKVREQGWATLSTGLVPGMAGLGVPVFDAATGGGGTERRHIGRAAERGPHSFCRTDPAARGLEPRSPPQSLRRFVALSVTRLKHFRKPEGLAVHGAGHLRCLRAAANWTAAIVLIPPRSRCLYDLYRKRKIYKYFLRWTLYAIYRLNAETTVSR